MHVMAISEGLDFTQKLKNSTDEAFSVVYSTRYSTRCLRFELYPFKAGSSDLKSPVHEICLVIGEKFSHLPLQKIMSGGGVMTTFELLETWGITSMVLPVVPMKFSPHRSPIVSISPHLSPL